jgi:hypothetical protein
VFLCAASSGNPITLPESISSSDLTGVQISPGVHWVCTEVPIDQLSHYGTKALQVLERFGLSVFE